MSVKKKLHEACELQIQNRINIIQKAMNDARESMNNESKSSAGDKHETGRAMMQLEVEKNGKQLQEALKQKNMLDQIEHLDGKEIVTLGSLVYTSTNKYYISVSIGKLSIDGHTYFGISPASPIGKQLIHKKIGQKISFNGNEQTIIEIQ